MYTDGSTNWIDYPLEFNTSVSGWQYCSKMFNLADDGTTSKTPSVVRLYLMDYNQANVLYFDNLQLIRADTEKSVYDDKGSVIRDDNGSYTYDEDGTMSRFRTT